jgi:hypothetical protein
VIRTLNTSDLYRLSRDIYSDPAAVLSELDGARLPKRLPIRAGRLAILRREPFDAGNLWSAGNAPRWQAREGYLPSDWLATYRRDVADGGAYVVYGYGTPIAWERSDGLRVVPPVSYSVSTARHQGEVRAAWGMSWGRTYSHPSRSMSTL